MPRPQQRRDRRAWRQGKPTKLGTKATTTIAKPPRHGANKLRGHIPLGVLQEAHAIEIIDECENTGSNDRFWIGHITQ